MESKKIQDWDKAKKREVRCHVHDQICLIHTEAFSDIQSSLVLSPRATLLLD